MIFILDFGTVLMTWNFFFIIICRLINYMPILTVRPLIDNKVYLMTTAAYFSFSVHHDFYVRCCSYLLTLTRGVSHVAQELLTLPEYLSSPPVFCEIHLTRSLVFYVMFCRSLFVLLHSFFFWSCYCLSFVLQLLIATIIPV
jgi:hypothetical protein